MNIKAASVQFQHTNGKPDVNRARIEHFVGLAAREDVRILAFPECCVTGYWFIRNLDRNELKALAEPVDNGPTTILLKSLSARHNMVIGAGIIEAADDGNLYNTYIVAMPDGTCKAHRKLHCFISKHMSSGSEYSVFDTPLGCRIGVLICYDNNIIENARITALMGAEILMAPHQTGGCRTPDAHAMGAIDVKLWENRAVDPLSIEDEFRGTKGRQWLMRWLPSRAHDNGMFVIFSNGVGQDDNEVRTGNAMILDPYGTVLAETWKADDDMVTADLDMSALERCTGRRWMKSRRPDLYAPIVQPTGCEQDVKKLRFEGLE